MGLRRSISGTLQRLNADEAVTELELAQLHNFVMFSLVLTGKVSPGTWAAAMREAEIAALLKDEVIDTFDEGYDASYTG